MMKIRFNQTSSTGSTLLEEQQLLRRIEYVQTKRKIQQFSTFIPDEVLQLHGSSQMGQTHHFVGVLLCVDIAGVIQLIEKYHKVGLGELYSMSLNMNAYTGSIIEVLRHYGGDVLSIFANDFVTLWKVQPEESMYEIIHTVVVCATVIQKLLGTYETEANVPLKLKTAVSCGNIAMGITGDNDVKQFVIVGDAFDSLRHSTKSAKFGDVVVTASAWPHMLQERYSVSMLEGENFVRILKITYKSSEARLKASFDEKFVCVVGLIEKHLTQRNMLKLLLETTRQLTNNKLVDRFIKSLPPRIQMRTVTRYWSVDDLKPFFNEIVFLQITESQPVAYLTEVREVTTICFKAVPTTFDSMILINTVNTMLDKIITCMKRLFATITNVFISEAGILINVVFGLILINHQNETLNALKIAYKIKTEVENMASVESASAGISSGIVYCSVLGHPLRREYVVIGRPVFKAQSLANQFPKMVTCDLNIFNSSKISSLYFKLVSGEVEDGVSEEVLIFQYDASFDVTEEIVVAQEIIDRVSDVNLISAMIQDPAQTGYNAICLVGPEMIGKTKILTSVYTMLTSQDCIYAFLTLLSAKFPYACISQIYTQLFDKICTPNAEKDLSFDIHRELIAYGRGASSFEEDLAMAKYRTLNRVRDLLQLTDCIVIIFIDCIQFLDQESWEILEIIIASSKLKVRLVMAGMPEESHISLMRKFNEAHVRIKEIFPLKDRFIGQLVCGLLNVEAVQARLITLLMKTCQGNPGYVECCILRLLNNQTIEMKFSNKENINTEQFVYRDLKAARQVETMFPVIVFTSNKVIQADELTMDLIYLDLFDSFTPFQQLVVKTGALLGGIFPRALLSVALNYPPEHLLASTIQILFEEKIFDCGSRFVSTKFIDPSVICCSCFFEEGFFNTLDRKGVPKYAYCKLIHFRNTHLLNVAYNRIPENQRRELHELCSQLLEKMDHICPNCVRNPANFYIFFGNYKEFVKYCEDPTKIPDFYTYAQDSFENIKETITDHMASTRIVAEGGDARAVLKEWSLSRMGAKYQPITRDCSQLACRCLEMLHVIYQDIINHAYQARESGKVIFYKLKFGLIQMCMRDISGAIISLTEARELSLSTAIQSGNEYFRKYHIGQASLGLAICQMKMKNLNAAKNNINIALRQYNIPTVAFGFKQFRILLKRGHLNMTTLKPYQNRRTTFGWELAFAMFICAKIFAVENNWSYARDCCDYSISLMKAVNNNIAILLDLYTDAVDVYRKSGDNESCERLQMYLVREFQEKYVQNNTFYLHTILDFLDVVIDVHMAQGNIKKSVRLGYRLMHLTSLNRVVDVNRKLMVLLCELNVYTLCFRDFIDTFTLTTRRLTPTHRNGLILHYLICMLCYNYTGFYIISFDEVLEFATEYFAEQTNSLSHSEVALKLLINVQFLRCRRFDRAKEWEVEYDYSGAVLSNSNVVKMMLFQMEGYLLHLVRNIRLFLVPQRPALEAKIAKLFALMKKAVRYNFMYRPAYWTLRAWYMMLKHKKMRAKNLLRKTYNLAKKGENLYYMAFVVRLKNYWNGGFLYEFESRPHVSIQNALSYSMEQFTQFLHPYILD